MNKIKKIIVLTIISITTLFIVFGFIIPNTLRSRESEMKRFLSDMGYQKAEIVDVSGWRYQVTFSTNKGVVNVVTNKNGGLAIKY
jgi:preprotein translocase subunit YajC